MKLDELTPEELAVIMNMRARKTKEKRRNEFMRLIQTAQAEGFLPVIQYEQEVYLDGLHLDELQTDPDHIIIR